MRAWVARVERIGNLNYPDEARRRNLQGQLVMTVAIRRDGSIEDIQVVQPSGYPILDDAAQRVVRLGEPYAPLPETEERIDVLHITRTWQFLPGNVMRNR
jgi:protein TonB